MLKRARIEQGLSQEDLAKLINYSASHVSSVETGARPPKSDYLAVVGEALHCGGLFVRLMAEVVSLESSGIDSRCGRSPPRVRTAI